LGVYGSGLALTTARAVDALDRVNGSAEQMGCDFSVTGGEHTSRTLDAARDLARPARGAFVCVTTVVAGQVIAHRQAIQARAELDRSSPSLRRRVALRISAIERYGLGRHRVVSRSRRIVK
jgi:hypothetical protein